MRVARGFFFILDPRSSAARRVASRPHIEVESGTTRAVRPSSDATRDAGRDAGRARDDADASRARETTRRRARASRGARGSTRSSRARTDDDDDDDGIRA